MNSLTVSLCPVPCEHIHSLFSQNHGSRALTHRCVDRPGRGVGSSMQVDGNGKRQTEMLLQGGPGLSSLHIQRQLRVPGRCSLSVKRAKARSCGWVSTCVLFYKPRRAGQWSECSCHTRGNTGSRALSPAGGGEVPAGEDAAASGGALGNCPELAPLTFLCLIIHF